MFPKTIYKQGSRVQLWNHSEPRYNGTFGTVLKVEDVRSAIFYTVESDEDNSLVTCIDDELMEAD